MAACSESSRLLKPRRSAWYFFLEPWRRRMSSLSASAASVLLIHNHPSGDPQPSQEDVSITKSLRKAGELMGIEVLDHIVVSSTGYLSMKAQRLL